MQNRREYRATMQDLHGRGRCTIIWAVSISSVARRLHRGFLLYNVACQGFLQKERYDAQGRC